MSSTTSVNPDQSFCQVTEDKANHWHPAGISDRKLIELQNQLVKIRRLDDAFALVDFSPQAHNRLKFLKQT